MSTWSPQCRHERWRSTRSRQRRQITPCSNGIDDDLLGFTACSVGELLGVVFKDEGIFGGPQTGSVTIRFRPLRMSMKELLETKHPTAWAEFETGLIDESKLAKIFFKDGRPFDLEGLKQCMVNGYSYIDGIEGMLHGLKENNYELHAFTNYPIWYTMIEEKLKLSKYLSWTFCSCIIGKRKPAADSYMEVLHRLGVEPANCVFIDDRLANIEAAANAGMVGLHFKNVDSLKKDLSVLGVEPVAFLNQ